MGSLLESSTWEDTIYRIQLTDPILGGEDGIVNIQPTQLANRTRFLLGLIGREHTLTGHNVIADMVSPDAAIDPDKVVLDVPFSEINAELDACSEAMDALRNAVTGIVGSDGQRIEALSRAEMFLWNFGSFGYNWEFFTDELTMQEFEPRTLISTVAGDDTVVVDSTEGIAPGDTMLAFSESRNDAEIIVVKTVLTGNRFLATKALTGTRNDGCVASMAWKQTPDGIVATPQSAYLSKLSTVLTNALGGTFVINRDAGVGTFAVFYRVSGSDEWIPVDPNANEAVSEDAYEETYRLPGVPLRVMVVNNSGTNIHVNHMALIADHAQSRIDPIRKPVMLLPDEDVHLDEIPVKSSVFHAAYGDNFVAAEFLFKSDNGNTYVHRIEGGYEDTFDGNEALTAGMHSLYCRHISDVGDMSDWSDELRVLIKDTVYYFGFEGGEYVSGFDENTMFSLSNHVTHFGFEGTEDSAAFGEAVFIHTPAATTN